MVISRSLLSILLPIGALVLGACGGTDAAKSGVQAFRDRVNRNAFAEIYRTASPELRQSITEAEFVQFLSAVDRRLGAWQSAPDPARNVTRGTGGHLVRLTYQSQFARGAATEQFAWRIEGASPVLLGYHVSSPLLVAD
jgi:hypothetical protein